MKKVYEAWQDADGCGTTFAPTESIKREFENGTISKNAKLLHTVEADTWEQAMSLHYEKMGWSSYIPEGEPESCPNECGAIFYPQGSGDCPNCGNIC